MLKPNKALYDAKKIIAQIVTDVVNLEDINYTVPEVQTLLDGITVGGHKLQDEIITLNQIKAWQFLFSSLEQNNFKITKEYILQLHSLVAAQESLTWGEFRNGQVSISGTEYMPPKFSLLNQSWHELEVELKRVLNECNLIKSNVNVPYLNASHLNESNNKAITNSKEYIIYITGINLFAQVSRNQFFFDGNKRTGRMMMSGVLLSYGYPMINVPAKRKLEFNRIMINYYNDGKLEPLYNFFISCLPENIIEEYSLQQLVSCAIQH